MMPAVGRVETAANLADGSDNFVRVLLRVYRPQQRLFTEGFFGEFGICVDWSRGTYSRRLVQLANEIVATVCDVEFSRLIRVWSQGDAGGLIEPRRIGPVSETRPISGDNVRSPVEGDLDNSRPVHFSYVKKLIVR